ncbi:MAG: hypothetical protein FWG98_04955 [Candidatus Cloacimonetes bacterium]|nr:hypothetical protein [Candidatus Cloacimonadota bacterium]
MIDNKNLGVISIIEEHLKDIKSLLAELEPLFNFKCFKFGGVRKQIEHFLETTSTLEEKANLTHTLIQGIIHSIHSSRKELKQSVDGLLKKTGDQLGKITATTEEATQKIMDEALKIESEQGIMVDKLEELRTATTPEDVNAKIEEIKGLVYGNQDSAFMIINYLQFQDITAQQIAGAYSLLSDTEKTLLYVSNLVKEFDMGDNTPDFLLQDLDKNAFNADAVFRDKADIQHVIDDIFNTGNTELDVPLDEVSVETKSFHANVPKSDDDTTNEDFDIDALFGANDDKANQDDIDKLFS